MKIGLTLGKFAPLHKGHEYLISCALSEMDLVIVVVYNASETTSIPTEIRASWITSLFPHVKVIIADDGPQDVGYTNEIKQKHEQYLIKLLGDVSITSFYSSEPYGEHISAALKCNNRLIDLKRDLHHISGTQIRNNPKQYKNYLSTIVYSAIKPKIVFLGGPSTGKTTLAEYCSVKYNTTFCPEYGREYWFKHQVNHRLTMEDLEIIAERHLDLEKQLSQELTDIEFVDTNIITTIIYSIYYFGNTSNKLLELFRNNIYRYTLLFLCDDDIPFDNSWDRSGPASRKEIQELTIAFLNEYKLNYYVLSGSVEHRFDAVNKYLIGD